MPTNEREAFVISENSYEQDRLELYRLIEEGLEDERTGRMRPLEEAMEGIRRKYSF
jgi:PHD/YefM family antitoxin component YafN of YafNO toxin-antitoxin module